MWIDVHAHLSELPDGDYLACLATARAARVGTIVDTGTGLQTSAMAARRAREHGPLVRACVGISPFDVNGLPASWIDDLRVLAQESGVIGIGETGMDAGNPRYPAPAVQQPVFEEHLALAAERNLPVILHSRGAESRVLDACISHGAVRAVFHCYTGSVEILRRILDAGFHVSFSGIVTFHGSGLDPLVRYVPLDRLFIETDSPYLAPVPWRGRRNQPAWVAEVGRKVAHIKEIAEEALEEHLCGTFTGFFGVAPGDSTPVSSVGTVISPPRRPPVVPGS